MASVDRLPSGRWRARWRERPNGPQKYRSFRLKVEAQQFLVQVQADLAKGEYVDPAGGVETFDAYATRWAAMQPWRASTADHVETQMAHIRPALGSVPLHAIRTSHVQALVGRLSSAGLAPSTVRGIARLVASIMGAAVADRLIARNPATGAVRGRQGGVKLPRPTRTHHSFVPLTVEEVHELAGVMPGRYRALVLATAGLGLRQGEACGLTVDRVDFLRHTVRVDRQLVTSPTGPARFGPPKTQASERIIPLAEEVGLVLAAHLERYGAGDDGLIFTTETRRPIRRQRVSALMRAAIAQAELAGVTFHDLRHFAASALIAEGCSVKAVQAFLGHATAAETLDTYGHLWPSDDDTIRRAIGRVLGSAGGAESRLSHEGTADGL